MAKKIVKFDVKDGRKPRKLENTDGQPFGLRAPIDISVPPRTSLTLKLGLSCPYPVIVVSQGGTELHAPGSELTAKFQSGEDRIDFGDGEVLAHAFVIVNSDLVLE